MFNSPKELNVFSTLKTYQQLAIFKSSLLHYSLVLRQLVCIINEIQSLRSSFDISVALFWAQRATCGILAPLGVDSESTKF